MFLAFAICVRVRMRVTRAMLHLSCMRERESVYCLVLVVDMALVTYVCFVLLLSVAERVAACRDFAVTSQLP